LDTENTDLQTAPFNGWHLKAAGIKEDDIGCNIVKVGSNYKTICQCIFSAINDTCHIYEIKFGEFRFKNKHSKSGPLTELNC